MEKKKDFYDIAVEGIALIFAILLAVAGITLVGIVVYAVYKLVLLIP